MPSIPADNQVLFYKRDRADFGFLSNFYPRTIYINGKTWAHTEALYQSQKSKNPAYHRYVRQSDKPSWAKFAGDSRIGLDKLAKKSWFRNRPQDLCPDWDSRKMGVMRIALFAKFTQHTDLRCLLVSTNDATLIEDSKRDTFWGTGREKQGLNWLGVLLMELRQQLGICETIGSELQDTFGDDMAKFLIV